MKTVNKVERIMVSFVYALMVWIPMLLGSWTFLYDVLDLYEDETMLLWVPYALAATYWIVRKLVFRIIRICKEDK